MRSANTLRNEFQASGSDLLLRRRLALLLFVLGSELLRDGLLDFLGIHAIPLGGAEQRIFRIPAVTLVRPIE